jgi:hypothetical protein
MSTPMTVAREFASFDDEWSAGAYLADYYTEIENDEQVTMRFLVDAAAFVGDVPELLEFGCGPTVHHLFPFAERASEIHLCDYLQRNVDAVRDWVDGGDGAHDWSSFAAFTLEIELGRAPAPWEVLEREAVTRERITSLRLADARRRQPLLGGGGAHRYPAVLCCFCPDSITDDLAEWRDCTANVASLVAPGGWLVLTALRNAASYRVGGMHFPSAGVTEDEVLAVLREAGFSRLGTTVIAEQAADDSGHGFDSVVLAVSRKP